MAHSLTWAQDFNTVLKMTEKASNELYPGLKSYTCDVKTSQFDVMMRKMTSSMPKDMPRPESPNLKKYWHKKMGMKISLEGKNVFSYMREFSKKMTNQFALELNGFFLPKDKSKERKKLLDVANKRVEKINGGYLLIIDFQSSTNIDNIFFKNGLSIPTDKVSSLAIKIDEKDRLVKGMEIVYDSETKIVYEIEAIYEKKENHNLLTVLNLTAHDNSVKSTFTTEFTKINGYYLPKRQIRVLEGKDIPEEQKNITVEFENYEINKKIPRRIFYEN